MTRVIDNEDLIRLYAEPGYGYTDEQMGEKFGVRREAIYKRRKKLHDEYGLDFIETKRGHYRIDSETLVSHIKVSQSEALVLYLATRRLSRQTPLAQGPVKEALSKLSKALYKPMTEKLVQASSNAPQRANEEKREQILDELICSWSEERVVTIKYKALGRKKDAIWHDVSLYLIEPSPWSDSVYLIGYSDVTKKITAFSLERIEKATMALTGTATFAPCDAETEEKLLQYAWGIWFSEGEPKELVKLKFSGYRAVRRLRESSWHPNQHIDGPTDNSYAIWQAPVAEPQEMLPWIRGWGSDVEVLEPERLREAIKGHVWKLAQTYALTTQTSDITTRLLRLWGKTTKNPDVFHPALYHMIDVAHVAQQLLSPRATPRWRQVLADALNADVATLHEWLPYLIALHDMGKISVPFQILNTRQHTRLKAEGFSFGKAKQADGRKLHHSIVGRMVLQELIANWPQNLAIAFQEMVSGHHGVFQQDTRIHKRDFKWLKEAEEWSQLRRQTIRILQSYLLQQWPNPLPDPTNQSVAMMALNGFCILCDWLGSDEDYFTPAPHTNLIEYIPKSRQQAYKRVKEAGFFQKFRSFAPTQFAQLFGFDPRPLQSVINDIPDDLLRQPTLTIIEAPTGEGKTETALALARRIGALRGTDEMYIALPTTATSNAMFERIQTHLQKRLGLPADLVKLVHGQDFLVEDDLRIKPMDSIEPGKQRDESPALAWFSPKKKALLAPFGVGTIDQAELSALNVRHNALRMIGLAGKTVILDEVHAYDTYMTTIIKRMVTWLAALGSSVVLLSATLPKIRRQELAQAFAGEGAEKGLDLEAYPSVLTIGAKGHCLSTPEAYQPGKTLNLHLTQFTADDAEAKAKWLLEQVQHGGCICWINNTVKRTQQIYAALLNHAPDDVDLEILHARFPLDDRKKREESIMGKYDKDGSRPKKGIVVGTQVLEQSLDLDFEVMITDLAPIDLVLQRAGRLHRHEREASVRYNHQVPHLYVNTILETADITIYDEYILTKSLSILEKIDADSKILSLPVDYRPLIDTVYHGQKLDQDDPLYTLWDELDTKQINLEDEADLRLMEEPDPDYPFYRGAKPQGFKEDEDGGGWLVAPTRWGKPSLTIIPLLRDGDTVQTLSGKVVPLNQAANRKTQLDLLRQTLRISNQNLIKQLKADTETYKLFADSALLRNSVPLWLQPAETKGGFISKDLSISVELHPELGLIIGEL